MLLVHGPLLEIVWPEIQSGSAETPSGAQRPGVLNLAMLEGDHEVSGRKLVSQMQGKHLTLSYSFGPIVFAFLKKCGSVLCSVDTISYSHQLQGLGPFPTSSLAFRLTHFPLPTSWIEIAIGSNVHFLMANDVLFKHLLIAIEYL